MKKLLSLIATAVIVLLAMGSPASAQISEDEMDMLGMESGYFRMFYDISADADALDGDPAGVMVGVFVFEDTDVVEEHMEHFAQGMAEGLFSGNDFELDEVRRLGEEAYEAVGTMDWNGDEMPASMVAALQDEYVFISLSIGAEDTDLDMEVVEYMLDAEPSDTRVRFDEDGTSTGGVFDMMPTTDDVDGLENMDPLMDVDFSEEM